MKKWLLAFIFYPLITHCKNSNDIKINQFFSDIASDTAHWFHFTDSTAYFMRSSPNCVWFVDAFSSAMIRHGDSTDRLWLKYYVSVTDSTEIAQNVKHMCRFRFTQGMIPGKEIVPRHRLRRIGRLLRDHKGMKFTRLAGNCKGVSSFTPPIFYNNGKKAIIYSDCYYYIQAGFGGCYIFELIEGKWRWKERVSGWVS